MQVEKKRLAGQASKAFFVLRAQEAISLLPVP